MYTQNQDYWIIWQFCFKFFEELLYCFPQWPYIPTNSVQEFPSLHILTTNCYLSTFLNFFFVFEGHLLYSTVLDLQQCESATCIHMSTPSGTSLLLPPSHPSPFSVVTEHGVVIQQLRTSYLFTYGNICVSVLLSHQFVPPSLFRVLAGTR